MVKWVKIFKTEKAIEIQLVRPTEVCGKGLSEKNDYTSVKTALLLSNVIDVDHQNLYYYPQCENLQREGVRFEVEYRLKVRGQ